MLAFSNSMGLMNQILHGRWFPICQEIKQSKCCPLGQLASCWSCYIMLIDQFFYCFLFQVSHIAVIPNLFGTRDWFLGRQFSNDWRWGDSFRMIQVHYIYCVLYFYYYYYISSTSDHQVLDYRTWGPLTFSIWMALQSSACKLSLIEL